MPGADAALSAPLVAPFLKLLDPGLRGRALERERRALLARVRAGAQSFSDMFVALGAGGSGRARGAGGSGRARGAGAVAGAASLLKAQEGVYYLKLAARAEGFGPAFRGLLEGALARLKALRASRIHVRVVKDGCHRVAARTLSRLGFRRLHERVEYRALLSRLPADRGSPIRWRALGEGPAALRRAARLLEDCGRGDPDWSPEDDALELLEGYLSDPKLTGGRGCVHVGEAAGREAAIVVAQVNRASGWSRITYMGLVPELRGRGLGRWVHRHGFAMLKAQGGRVYHGGTLAANRGMIRLFERHRCAEHRRLEEWALRLGTTAHRGDGLS